jgi:hypothetical protein
MTVLFRGLLGITPARVRSAAAVLRRVVENSVTTAPIAP